MGINRDRNLPVDNLDLELVGTELLELRKDTSSPSRTIVGWAQVGTAQTASEWLIYADDQVGTNFHRQFAEVASVPIVDFVHQWSNRNNILPNPTFLNEFSIQLSGSTDQYGVVAHAADLDFDPLDAFSISIWFKTTNGVAELYQKTSSTAGNNGYWMRLDSNGRFEFSFRGTGTGQRIRVRTDSFTDGDNGSWHNVIVTKASGSAAASTVKIYADGNDETLNVLNDTLTGASDTTSGLDMSVGANISGSSRFLGNLDEYSIWDVELTSTEVAEIYNSNNGVIDLEAGSTQIAADLVSWWRFGDGSFIALPTIPDEIGSNDMTMQTAVTSGDIEGTVPP